MTDVLDAPATLGHNNPPEPTPFELSRQEIDDLYDEAKHWCDGEPVDNAGAAEKVSLLIDKIRKAAKTADERRIAEAKPHDDAKREIQTRYNTLIGDTKSTGKGKAVLAVETAKAALVPWLKRLEEEQRAAAEVARIAAEEAQAEAIAAMRAAREASDLEAREAAEALAQVAKAADKIATAAENTKAHATGGTRAMGLRTTYRAEMTDAKALAAYVWTNHRAEMVEWLTGFARRLVAGGNHKIPGVTIHIDQVL